MRLSENPVEQAVKQSNEIYDEFLALSIFDILSQIAQTASSVKIVMLCYLHQFPKVRMVTMWKSFYLDSHVLEPCYHI